ncbi:MAG: DUF302 domain-containing protein [Capsulimonas sp.]|uniref:DUF302 domain-containing protein n=1 Tax=Capsulimonas sp. TaxID=2494211 RepID=UPI003264A9B2
MMERSITEHVSSLGFEATLERLEQEIAKGGMSVFARIDHAAGAREFGLEMPPTVVLLYGSPRGGTPIMLEAPLAALDLPLRVLVRQDAKGQVLIAFHPAAPMLRQAGVPEELATRLDPAQRILCETIWPDGTPP